MSDIKSLENDADQFSEEAEGKAGTLMAQLITKSNTLCELNKVDRVGEKASHRNQIGEWRDNMFSLQK